MTPRGRERDRCTRSPTRSRPTSTRIKRLEMRELSASPPRSSSSRWTSPSTTGGSSPAAPASSRAAPRASTSRSTRRYVRRDPLGVVGSIAPWNYPLNMATWKLGPALAAGNTVVLKPSELTPLTALRLAEITADILPPGVLNVVTGQGETAGDALVRHPKVAMVSLTGSVETGKLIARTAADTLKRVHLELGGKAPVVIFDDADIEAAVAMPHRDGVLQLGPGLHRAVPAHRRARRSSTTSSAGSPTRSARSSPATRSTRRPRWARSSRPTSSTGSAGMVARAVEAGAEVDRRRRRDRPARLLLRAVGRREPGPGQRDRAARGVRPGRLRAALHRRGAGARLGQRRRLRPVGERVDERRRPGDAHERGAPLRLRVGQRPHPDRLGDAARRLQAVAATARTCRSTRSRPTPSSST